MTEALHTIPLSIIRDEGDKIVLQNGKPGCYLLTGEALKGVREQFAYLYLGFQPILPDVDLVCTLRPGTNRVREVVRVVGHGMTQGAPDSAQVDNLSNSALDAMFADADSQIRQGRNVSSYESDVRRGITTPPLRRNF